MRNVIRITAVIGMFAFAAATVYISAQIKTEQVVTRTAILMGTIVEIKVPIPPRFGRRDVEPAVEKAMDEMRRVENLFSKFIEDSEISRINGLAAGESLKIDGEVFALIEKAVDFCNKTDGAFDITVKPLVDLWSEAKEAGSVPSAGQIKEAKEKAGCANIKLDKVAGTITLARNGVAIDMGGIVKGYAADMAVKALADGGVKNAIVNCGGDMYCLGRRSPNEQWRVGIQDPRAKGKLMMELRLEDRAIDTSGDYEKFYILDGRRYSHIIDPRTGYPVGDDIVSASVVAGESVTADALATALCVLGRDGMKKMESFPGVDCVTVALENGILKTRMSEHFKERYHAIETAARR